jgi:hypothetical protein
MNILYNRFVLFILIALVSCGNLKNNAVIQEYNSLVENSVLLNVDFKLRASKLAIGKNKESGGWYVNDNEAKPIKSKFTKEGTYLLIDEQAYTQILDTFLANRLYLVNNSEEKNCFTAQDSRLDIVMQAKNYLGIWRDIEYLPQSWCGNSFHEICLNKNQFWEFPSPIFEGKYKTKLRYKLTTPSKTILSNEIGGYINPGQFRNKLPYTPKSLMDPYTN